MSKKPINPIILTEYSLFPKSTSSTSTKSLLQAKNATFFWQGHGQKVPLRMHQNTPLQVKNSFFSGEGIAPPHTPSPAERGRGNPPHTSPQPSLLGPPCVSPIIYATAPKICQRPASNNVLRVLQISYKSVHFRRSCSRTRETAKSPRKVNPIFGRSLASSRIKTLGLLYYNTAAFN